MNTLSSQVVKSVAVRTAVALAAVAGCAVASAATSFTFDPSKVAGVSAPVVTADTLTVNDYANVILSGAAFTETGFLAVNSFNLGNTVAASPGLNSSYGVYASFTAAGSNGILSMLNYNVYEYTGPAATFMVSAAGATKSATTDTLIGTGMLGSGGSNTFGGGVGGAFLIANSLTFNNVGPSFSPISTAFASFVNSSNQVTGTPNGFYVTAGGGTVNLIPSAVPEPETYALLLGGLAAVGFVTRRRKNV